MSNEGKSVPEGRDRSRQSMAKDASFRELSLEWMRRSIEHRYSYQYDWMGRPIIQYPQDIAAVQEIIWRTRPDLIVETGVAHGGSIIFSASMLELLGGDGRVVAVDIDIRRANRREIEAHPMSTRITLIEGSSIDEAIVTQVRQLAEGRSRVLVLLDSNHTHDHVLRELELYSPLVQPGSYVVVFDTIIEDMPEGFYADRPWDRGDNPKTAVHEFLRRNGRFEIDRDLLDKLWITVCPDGYLRCVKS
jgi:cephalosporin hydroxylase